MSEKFVELIENSLPVLRRAGDIETMSLDGFSFENIKRGEYAFHVMGKLDYLEKSELLAAFRKVGSGVIAPIGGDGTESLEKMCQGLAEVLAAESLDDSIKAGPLSIVAACAVVGIGRGFDYDKDTVEDVRRSDRQLIKWCIQYLKEHAAEVSQGVDLSFVEKFQACS